MNLSLPDLEKPFVSPADFSVEVKPEIAARSDEPPMPTASPREDETRAETEKSPEVSAPNEALAMEIPNLTDMALAYRNLSVTQPEETPQSPALEAAMRSRLERFLEKARLGRTEEAQRDLVRLAAELPYTRTAPEALFRAAELEKTDVSQRIRGFFEVARLYPHTSWGVESLQEIGNTRFLTGDYAGALDAWQAYRIRNGKEANTPSPRMRIVTALSQLRRYQEAFTELQSFEADFPSRRMDEKVLDVKSECQIALGRYAEAILTLRDLLNRYPNYALTPKALLALGLCYEEIGQPEAARQQYQQILDYYPPARPDTPFETNAAARRLDALEKPLFARN